ncbi:hypothetical protein [Bradyrhizobium pachyrhizi]|uniref:hypothetical protein n=1 Tax=Bradyrhizobium pachyrhizi TaxID=280333 RepID=UPI003D36DBF9
MKRARQAEAASHITEWLALPGLQPPTAVQNLQPAEGRTEARETVKLMAKVKNSGKPSDDGEVSRNQLKQWQREDASRRSKRLDEAHPDKPENEGKPKK